MERTTPCDLSSASVRQTVESQDYSEPLAEISDSPLILGPKAGSACSGGYAEIIVTPAPIHPAPGKQRPLVQSSRLLDVGIAGLIFLFVLPLMALCALAIAATSRGPIIYRQLRIGQGGREFTCFKFRTMTECAAASIDQLLVDGSPLQEEWAAIYKLRCDPRVTPLGRFLRRYSVDELPQLFNVFRGDMSVIGPRPIVAEEIRRYGDHFADYCSVKPGITGLWQVSGRHALSYEERVRLDAQYANHKTLRLDLLILWRTLPIVLFGQNE